MGLIALVRGFKYSVSKFDDFLISNGLNPTEGYFLFPQEAAEVAKLFRNKGVDCEVKVFVPHVTGFNRSQYLFICCEWAYVLAVGDIDSELQKSVPPSFETMRLSLGAQSGISRYVVYNADDETWMTEELFGGPGVPADSGVCDEFYWPQSARQ